MDVEPEKTSNSLWPLVAFVSLAYAIAWLPIPLLSLVASQAGLNDWVELNRMSESWAFDREFAVPHWALYAISRLQDFSFTVSGLVIVAWSEGAAGLRKLASRLIACRFAWPLWLFALLPYAFYLVATWLAGALPSAQWDAATAWKVLFSLEAGFVATLLLRGPMGEELGLRGYALPALQQRMSPFAASAVIGLFWAAWHIPVLNGREPVAVVAFLLIAFSLSFVFTLLFRASGGSLIPPLLFHATQNSEEVFESVFPALAGADWELPAALLLLGLGLLAMAILWRTPFASAEPPETPPA